MVDLIASTLGSLRGARASILKGEITFEKVSRARMVSDCLSRFRTGLPVCDNVFKKLKRYTEFTDEIFLEGSHQSEKTLPPANGYGLTIWRFIVSIVFVWKLKPVYREPPDLYMSEKA